MKTSAKAPESEPESTHGPLGELEIDGLLRAAFRSPPSAADVPSSPAAELVHRDDPGVLQLPADLRFLDEPGERRVVVRQALAQDFHRELASQVLVANAEHDAHPAARDLVDDAVLAALALEPAARGELRRGRTRCARGGRRRAERGAEQAVDLQLAEGPVRGFGLGSRRLGARLHARSLAISRHSFATRSGAFGLWNATTCFNASRNSARARSYS